MKTGRRVLNPIVLFLLILTVSGCVFAVCGDRRAVYADPPRKLSDRKFTEAITEMTAEYDKDVTQRQAERNPYLSERLIVKSADPNLDPDDYGAVDAIQDRNGTYILQFESSAEAKRAAKSIAAEETTVYVEPDGYLFACGFSDSFNEELWGDSASMIGADQYAQALTGAAGSVRVAVLDTGISFTSLKLAGKLDTVHAKSFVSNDEGLLNVDQSQESSTEQKARHGTHVAGIIAQCTESLPNIVILPIRVLNNAGKGSILQVVNGIRYAADQGAEVINLSLSGKLTVGGETIRQAIDYAISRGTAVVVVSGNYGVNVADYTPGNIEECIVVGAVNSGKARWYGSNYGSTVDLVAPGVDVYSTSWENLTNGYNQLSGTSMAAPHAAAAAALIKLANSSYSPAAIEHLLQTHAEDLGNSGKDDYYGYGMVDMSALLNDENPDEELDEWNTQNQQAADAVIALIDALPTPVTLDDKEAVEAARAAYDALTFAQKQLVTNYSVLEDAEAAIAQLEADKSAADEVVEQIDALPSLVTLADKEVVEAARAAYDALTDAQKSFVTNLSVLEDAEAVIEQLEADKAAADAVVEQIAVLPSSITLADKEAVEAARAAYEELTESQKSFVTNLSVLEDAEAAIAQAEEAAANQAAADVVIGQIDALPSPITLVDKAVVEAARTAYNALTDTQKDLVTNLSVLEDAEAIIQQLEADKSAADEVVEQIDALPSLVTLADKEVVEAARAAYDALTDAQKSFVTNLSVLEDAEAAIEQLEADKAAADEVVEQIDALPSVVTLDDKDAVEAARAAYEELTESQKSFVTNLSVLEDAEAVIEQLEADKAAADAVVEQISELPSPVTLADKETVEAARAAYDALTDAQKALVTNLSALEDAEAVIEQLEADKAAADAVIGQIDALPTPVALTDKEAVEAARTAYNALTDTQKALVTNLSVLEDAETVIQRLEADQEAAQAVISQIGALPTPVTLADKEAVEAARAAFNALTDAQKALVSNLSILQNAEAVIQQLEADKAAADAVVEQIAALPSPVTLADKESVEAARAAYEALTTSQKSFITNLSVLEAAETAIAQAEEAAANQAAADEVIDQINALPSAITTADKAAVEAARAAYEGLTEDQKSLVTNLSVLEEKESALQKAMEEEQDSTENETEQQESAKRKYPGTNPKPNVTYSVPLKTRQKTKKLKVTGLAGGDKVISWTSSNKKKAKVTGKPDGTCVIKAGKKTGKVSITAVTASGRKIVFRLRIRKNKVKTKKIETDKPIIRLHAGEQVRLKTTLVPITSTQKRTYSSKNKAIATVTKKGVIRGIAPGSTKIIVYCGKVKLRIRVIVD